MILGVGIDVVDIARFGETLTRTPAMRDRLFTAAERERPLASLAARFAAKEALAKALGAPDGMRLAGRRDRQRGQRRPALRACAGSVQARADGSASAACTSRCRTTRASPSAVVVLES